MEKLFNDSFENWIFDLDNTIYDIKSGLFVKISERITEYIMEVLSFTKEEANLVRSNMYKKYGLTLTGLMREYNIDPDEYVDFIHDVTHPELKYEKQLQKSLNNLSGRKFIYTNASQSHAKKILSAMGLEAEFEKILDIKTLPKNLDATDGLAAAVCHYYNKGKINLGKSYSGWSSFVNQNPNKVKS